MQLIDLHEVPIDFAGLENIEIEVNDNFGLLAGVGLISVLCMCHVSIVHVPCQHRALMCIFQHQHKKT